MERRHPHAAGRPARRAAATRSFISPAALFVNVIARISNGDTPSSRDQVREPVREHPGLARPGAGDDEHRPVGSVTASCWAGFRPERSSSGLDGAASAASGSATSGMAGPSYRPPRPIHAVVRSAACVAALPIGGSSHAGRCCSGQTSSMRVTGRRSRARPACRRRSGRWRRARRAAAIAVANASTSGSAMFGRGGGDPRRPAAAGRVAVERELADDERGAAGVEQRTVHHAVGVGEHAQVRHLVGELALRPRRRRRCVTPTSTQRPAPISPTDRHPSTRAPARSLDPLARALRTANPTLGCSRVWSRAHCVAALQARCQPRLLTSAVQRPSGRGRSAARGAGTRPGRRRRSRRRPSTPSSAAACSARPYENDSCHGCGPVLVHRVEVRGRLLVALAARQEHDAGHRGGHACAEARDRSRRRPRRRDACSPRAS